ncbi:unnamed protein product [Prunus armeniaca]
MAEIPELVEAHVGQRGRALVVQEQEVPTLLTGPSAVQPPWNQPELPSVPRLEVPQGLPIAHLPEHPIVVPYRPRRIDPNSFPPTSKG